MNTDTSTTNHNNKEQAMTTERLCNFTPATASFYGSPVTVHLARSEHAFGNLDDALAYAATANFSHVEAKDVRTDEAFYLAADAAR